MELQSARCVFKRNSSLILVYVDDILIIAPEHSEIESVKSDLSNLMPTQDLGPVEHFLGVDISIAKHKVTLKQSKGITSHLQECKMSNSRFISTPLEFTIDYSLPDTERCSENLPYRSILSSILYVSTKTCPDLSVAVSILAQHQNIPGKQQERGLLRLLKYLNSTCNTELILEPGPINQLSVYVDSN